LRNLIEWQCRAQARLTPNFFQVRRKRRVLRTPAHRQAPVDCGLCNIQRSFLMGEPKCPKLTDTVERSRPLRLQQ
jgi:hypothetical protein